LIKACSAAERLDQPLINRPFCPHKLILAWFSGSFANAHYQRSQSAMTTKTLLTFPILDFSEHACGFSANAP
jgi:hypothetical protein